MITPLPPPIAARILAEYPGTPYQPLAKKYGVDPRRVRKLLAEEGRLRRTGKGRAYEMPAERCSEICAAYLAGGTTSDLMRRYRIGETKLQIAFIEGGIEPRPQGRPRRALRMAEDGERFARRMGL